VCSPCNSIPFRTGYNFIQWFSGFGASAPRLSRDQIAQVTEGLKMKKLVLALTALAAFTGSAVAADLPARTYTKAPPPAPVYNWTGFYIFGGGGYGLWDSNTDTRTTAGALLTVQQKTGGNGYYGTAGIGYDWQVNQSWVAGILADGQFGSIRGTNEDFFSNTAGQMKNTTNAAAGVRVGYLVAPNVLSYVNGGYSYAQFSGTTLLNFAGTPISTLPSFHRNGWFVGGGVENNLDIFGISAPGWFMKTEYRVAEYNKATLTESVAGVPNGLAVTVDPIVQTVSTSLVYRFNWGTPVVAKY
jgi:outer membrane immunogenic protein